MSLWRLFNLQIARVIEGTPEASRQRPRPAHNFEVIGVELADGEAATLQHIMTGYVSPSGITWRRSSADAGATLSGL